MRALAVGRFQPFHLGHLHLVRQALSEYDEVIVAVTSSQFSYLEKDPFTAGERIEMIRQSLSEAKVDLARCIIVPLENVPHIATWACHLRSSLPRFGVIISGNPYIEVLLAGSDIEVKRPELLDRDKYSASKIRQMIIQNNSWENFVPPAVAGIIKEVGGVRRLQVISKSDTKPTEN